MKPKIVIYIANKEVDIFDDINFEIDFEIKNLQEITNKGTFTKSLTLPATKINNQIFSYVFDLNIVNGIFNPLKKNPIIITINGNQILDGYCELANIQFENNKVIAYELTAYGENSNLFRLINEDTYINQLDFSELNHTLNGVNVINSWTNFENGTVDYVYPLVDYGKGMKGFLGDAYGSATYPYITSIGLTPMDLYPAIRVKKVFDKIFEFAGLTYTSNFLNLPEFKNLIIPFHNDITTFASGQTSVLAFSGAGNYSTLSHYSSYQLIPNNTYYFYEEANVTNNICGIIPIDTSLYQPYQNGHYYSIYNYYYNYNYQSLPSSVKFLKNCKVKIMAEYQILGMPSGYNNKIQIEKLNYRNFAPLADYTTSPNDSSKFILSDYSLILGNVNTPNDAYYTLTWEGEVEAGDMLFSRFVKDHMGFAQGAAIRINYFKLYILDDYIDGININFNKFFQEKTKCKDFLSDIFKLFNLFCKKDKTSQNNYIIEPYTTFFNSNVVDWSHKIDLTTKNVELLNNYKSFKFEYANDDDFYTKQYTENYGKTYSEYTVQIDNDFGEEKKIKLSLFSPTVLNANKTNLIEGLGWLKSSDLSLGTDTQEVVPYNEYPKTLHKPRILFFKNASLHFNTPNRPLPLYYARNFRFNNISYNFYPYAGHLDDPDHSTLDLNFDTVQENMLCKPINATFSGITNNNLYNKYYNDYITQLASPASKILKAKFNLTPEDIATFDYSNYIYIASEQAYFIAQKIQYRPDELSDIELIKLDNVNIDYNKYKIPTKNFSPLKRNKLITNKVGNLILSTVNDDGKPIKGLIIGENNIVSQYNENIVYSTDSNGITFKAEETYTPLSGFSFVVGNNNNVSKSTNNFVIGNNNKILGNSDDSRNVIINSHNITLQPNQKNITLIGVNNLNENYILKSNLVKVGDSSQYVHIDSFNVSEGQYNSIISGDTCHAQGKNNIIIRPSDLSLYTNANDPIIFDATIYTISVYGDLTSHFNVGDTILVEDFNNEQSEIVITGLSYNSTYTTFSASSIPQDVINAVNNNLSPYIINLSTALSITGATAIGFNNKSFGHYSFSQGSRCLAIGDYSHAEGMFTKANGIASHSEGCYTTAIGDNSHAEGLTTTSIGFSSHAEGANSKAIGYYSHAEGLVTTAYTYGSHAEGANTLAKGENTHAEGFLTKAIKETSHAEGAYTIAQGLSSHAEGANSKAIGFYSHAEGNGAYAEGESSHAEGTTTNAVGISSHAEGKNTTSYGNYSHAEGYNSISFGEMSHAEGFSTANGVYSHSEGFSTYANGEASHAEGSSTTANNDYAHAEGTYTVAGGYASHAEGSSTTASGDGSHAGGIYTEAIGIGSFAHGSYCVAKGTNTAVFGGSIIGGRDNTLYTNNIEIVGNGNGIVMQSPDGTRYLLTIANGGTISITLA